MAFQAERHAEGFRVSNLVHLVDRPVALDTTETPVHVHRMIEIDVIGHFVDLHPGDRLARVETLPHQCQPRIVLEHLIVAIHASRCRRDIRIPRLFHGIVTVTAIQTKLIRVDGMGKAHRLDRLIPHPRVLRCEIIPSTRRDRAPNDHGASDHFSRKPICPLWKNV